LRATEAGEAAGLRARVAELETQFEAAARRLPALELEASQQSTKCQALDADLQAAMRRHADTESSLAEVRGALAAAQDELATARKTRTKVEGEQATLIAKSTKLEAQVTKLETQVADAKAAATAGEAKLKSRIEEVKQLSTQLGEATEELTTLKTKAAQLESNLTAAQATRKTLEKELAERTKKAASGEELAAVREQLREQERLTGSWSTKAEELEAELLATSRAHQALEKEMERLREAAGPAVSDESLAAELEIMTRERNDLAAELAALKASRNR
jgi:chromosome segregation ATPase